jgi:hypothetical protein
VNLRDLVKRRVEAIDAPRHEDERPGLGRRIARGTELGENLRNDLLDKAAEGGGIHHRDS